MGRQRQRQGAEAREGRPGRRHAISEGGPKGSSGQSKTERHPCAHARAHTGHGEKARPGGAEPEPG